MDLVTFYQHVISPPRPWKVERVECHEDERRVDVWLTHDPASFRCPSCMQLYPVYDHAPERIWRHLDTCEYQTFIHARLPRVQCREHGILTASVPFATPETSVTVPLETRCIRTLQECTLEGAAALLAVTPRKLQRIQRLAVTRALARRPEDAPLWIGLDEKQVFARHQYFTIITDLKARKIYDVIDKRGLKEIAPWFEAREAELLRTERVATDMSAGYAKVAETYMTNAELCFDKFHIIQVLNKAVDDTRKQEQQTMDAEQRKMMFRARFCFLYAKEHLPTESQERFNRAAAVAAKTARAWASKEELRGLWDLEPPEFEAQFKHWFWRATHSRLRYLVEAARTLKRHFQGILNAVTYGITNALTEGLNSKIEALKRSACGFRNKANFRMAILFHCGKLDLLPNQS